VKRAVHLSLSLFKVEKSNDNASAAFDTSRIEKEFDRIFSPGKQQQRTEWKRISRTVSTPAVDVVIKRGEMMMMMPPPPRRCCC